MKLFLTTFSMALSILLPFSIYAKNSDTTTVASNSVLHSSTILLIAIAIGYGTQKIRERKAYIKKRQAKI